MSIATEIQRLQSTKTAIKSAIENKGVTVGDGTIDTYAAKIDETDHADSGNADDVFFRIWTRREALTKALGGTVYDTDLPAVSGEYVMINDNRYIIHDVQLPSMPEIYSAVCIYNTDSISEPDFTRL